MLVAAVLVLLGIAMSAYFSGSETGFYRVTRVRLVMDAKSGNWVSQALLWLVNRPSVVVATVLIGNNIANYLVSLGLLLASQYLLASWSEQVQTLMPVLLTPFLFIYGELLPKYLYFQVPYRLLRAGAPLMIFCTALFLPISLVVIAIQSWLQKLTGESTTSVNATLERQDLQRTLLEGQEAGVVHAIQREIAQNVFTYGIRPVRQFAQPIRGLTVVEHDDPREVVEETARRSMQALLGVVRDGQLIGCYRTSDLFLTRTNDAPTLLPITKAKGGDSSIQVLTRMQAQQTQLAVIRGQNDRVIGIVTRSRLLELLIADN